MKTAFKVPVTESEKGWGRKIDDYMVCLTKEDALLFTEEFNAKNTASSAPDWYMQVEHAPVSLKITEEQYTYLNEKSKNKRMWLSILNNFQRYNDEEE